MLYHMPLLRRGMLCLGIGVCVYSIIVFRIRRWSAVDLPFWPPAWASVMFTVLVILLLIILSKSLPMLLARVIPLSLLHFPFLPLPL